MHVITQFFVSLLGSFGSQFVYVIGMIEPSRGFQTIGEVGTVNVVRCPLVHRHFRYAATRNTTFKTKIFANDRQKIRYRSKQAAETVRIYFTFE